MVAGGGKCEYRSAERPVLTTVRMRHAADFPETAAGKRATRRHAGRRNARNRYVHFRRASNPAAALFIMLSRGITPRPVVLVRSLCIPLDAARRCVKPRARECMLCTCIIAAYRAVDFATTTAAMMMYVHASRYLIRIFPPRDIKSP